jgi:plastocyanin
MRWLGGIFLAAVGGMALAACPAMAANFDVGMVGSAAGPRFSPEAITVAQGDSVTWTNGGGVHDVTFEDGLFQQPSPPNATIWTVSRTFDSPGTYLYYCSVHRSIGMTGSVVVSAAAPTGSSGSAPVTSGPAGTVGAQGQATPCKSQRNFQIRVRQPRGMKIKSASVSVNGTPVKVRQFVVGGKLRHVAQVDLRGLGKGTYKVDITATTDKGKKLRGTRTYQTCVAKLASSGLPSL